MSGAPECWAALPGWEVYSVSTYGRVRSHHARWGAGGRAVRLTRSKLGYFHFGVYDVDRTPPRRTVSVARSVLLAFRGPAPEGMECAHLDGDPANNRLENLAWVTHAANLLHKRQHGTAVCGVAHPNSRLTPEIVRAIRADREAGMRQKDVAVKYGVTAPHVRDIVRRRLWAHV